MWEVQRLESLGKYMGAVVPEHPKADPRGRVTLHRVVMENHIDRVLEDDEAVHHKNGDRLDNRLENLELMKLGEHTRLHCPAKTLDLTCPTCGKKFQRTKRRAKGKRAFCSVSCSSKFYVPKREPKPIRHGTLAGYRKCRCDKCRAAKAAAARKYRESRR